MNTQFIPPLINEIIPQLQLKKKNFNSINIFNLHCKFESAISKEQRTGKKRENFNLNIYF